MAEADQVRVMMAVCLPAALARPGKEALADHAGEDMMRRIADRAGPHH